MTMVNIFYKIRMGNRLLKTVSAVTSYRFLADGTCTPSTIELHMGEKAVAN